MPEQPHTALARRHFLILFCCLFSINMGQTLIFAILPPLGREVGFQELQINAIISVSALMFSFCSPRWGRFSDRVGRKRIMLTGLLGYSIGNFIFTSSFILGLAGLLSGSIFYALVVFLRVSQSTIMAAGNPAIMAYTADNTTPVARASTTAKLGTASNAGTILGPAVAGALAGISLLAPLYFAAALTLGAAVAVWYFLPESGGQSVNRSARIKLRYADRRYRHFIITAVGIFLAYSGIQQTLGFTLQDRMDLDGVRTAQLTGVALMLSALCSVFAQAVLIQRLQWPPLRFIRWGTPTMCAGVCLMLMSYHYYGLVMGMMLVGLGLGLSMPNVFAGSSLAVKPEEQGAIAGLIASLPAMGFILGPVVAGFLYQINAAYPQIFAIAVLASVSAYIIRMRSQ